MTDLVIFRAHRGDGPLHSVLLPFQQVGIQLVVAMDETFGPVPVPDGVAKVSLTASKLTLLGLFCPDDWAWRCGDYALYLVRKLMPEYDHYWLFEPDVRINGNPSDFFERFNGADEDFLATFLGPRGNDWRSKEFLGDFFPEVWGCLFPVVRLTGRAIDALFSTRVAFQRTWLKSKIVGKEWPNDEGFVASTLKSQGFSCSDLNSSDRKMYESGRGWSWHYPVALKSRVFDFPDDKIYHPVIDDEEAFTRRLQRAIRVRKARVQNVAWSLNTLPLNFDRPVGVDERCVAVAAMCALLEIGTCPDLHSAVPELANELFPNSQAPRITHHALRGQARSGFRGSQADDFPLYDGLSLPVFPRKRATAYAADFVTRNLTFVCTPAGKDLLSSPFFYLAQREHAESIFRIPFEMLGDLYDLETLMRPVILMSIGRCGSTMLNQLLAAAGATAVSEPDVFSQSLGLNGYHPSQEGHNPDLIREDATKVLRSTVCSLSEWSRSDPDGLVLKLRSQANAATQRILAAFPQARYVFVFREAEPWVRSFVTAFGHDPDAIARNLKRGVQACDALVEAGVSMEIVAYEDLVENPAGTVRKILGGKRILSERFDSSLSQIELNDSQAGTRISRKAREGRIDDASVESAIVRFREVWSNIRPAGAISRLKLPY